jgi:hypothetical protein
VSAGGECGELGVDAVELVDQPEAVDDGSAGGAVTREAVETKRVEVSGQHGAGL